mgnify:CR=1 FL=1
MNLLEDIRVEVLVERKKAKKLRANNLKGKDREEDLHLHPVNPEKSNKLKKADILLEALL